MAPIALAVIIGIAVYVAIIALIPRHMLKSSTSYTRSMLQRLEREKKPQIEESDELSVLREQTKASGLMARVFMALPGSGLVYPSLLRAGMSNSVGEFFTACLLVAAIALYLLSGMGILSVIAAPIIVYFFGKWYIKRRITKRNNAFLNHFPDALDMVVRSVRSGYPLSSAIRMVADNMQPPISTEFKQMSDEIAYGSTMVEALQRMALRIDEQDVRFFVVVLTVQQDVGGNLSEVLGNLSGIIRKRKHLRLKMKALASEGKATAWVLGSMPFIEGLLILTVSPRHMDPLLYTATGHMFLGATAAVMAAGIFIVAKIVNIKV